MIEEPICKLGSNSRIQFASNESKIGSYEFGPGTPWKVDLIFENGVQISFFIVDLQLTQSFYKIKNSFVSLASPLNL
jgi:hypothetical protein